MTTPGGAVLATAAAKTSVTPGDVIAGRYVVEEMLGSGGMGIVVGARHEALGHRVAMKLVSGFSSGTNAAHADAFVRFSREARIIASLESDHVVRVLDYGMHAGSPYMVMELLAGRDLGSELTARGALPSSEAADYVIQACDGLWAAHTKGIVHRDVKTANLFVSVRADGERVLKVLDFGVSKLQVEAHEDLHLTRTTTMLGSPAYMSPEQIRDPRTVDARADVWSLGIVLYKLLTNRVPFHGISANAVCAAIAADEPAPMEAFVAPSLAAIVMRCLEKRPEARFSNVAALARALAPFASQRWRDEADRLAARATADGMLESVGVLTALPDDRARDAVSDTVDESQGRPQRRTGAITWIGVTIFAVMVAAVAMRWKSQETAPSTITTMTTAPPALTELPAPPTPVVATQPVAAPLGKTMTRPVTPPRSSARKHVAPPTRTPTASRPSTTHFGGSALDDHN